MQELELEQRRRRRRKGFLPSHHLAEPDCAVAASVVEPGRAEVLLTVQVTVVAERPGPPVDLLTSGLQVCSSAPLRKCPPALQL